MRLSSAQRRIIESKASISDNEVTNLLHHVEDAQKQLHNIVLKTGKTPEFGILASSLNDIAEIARHISTRFSAVERSEL